MITLGGVIDMPKLSFDEATPVMSERAIQLKEAIICAADIKVDLTNDCLIKNWLGESAISVVYGDSNCGKSFFAVDLAYHVAAGRNWFGNRVKTGRALYVAAEGSRGFAKRIEAVKIQKPELHTAGCENFSLLPVQVNLHGHEDASAIINQASNDKYSLVVIDTLAMSIGEGSENDGRDMGMFISNIMRLKAHFGCHIMIIHHTGKDRAKGARGHSSLRAAMDTEIELKADGLVRVALTTKQRDMQNGKKIAFTLDAVELGKDDDLDAITSCIVTPTNIPEGTTRKKALEGYNEVAHQALCDALKNNGRKIKKSEHYPSNRQVVGSDHWYAEFRLRRGIEVKPETIRKSFSRARDWLQEYNYIREYEDKIWFIDDPDRQDK
jgi:hypothetical protein